MITESGTDCTQPLMSPQPAAQGWEDRRSELIQWLRSARKKTGEVRWDKKKETFQVYDARVDTPLPGEPKPRWPLSDFTPARQEVEKDKASAEKSKDAEARVHVAVQGMQSAREELERADDIPDMQKATELCSAVVRQASAVFAEKVDSDGSKRFQASSR